MSKMSTARAAISPREFDPAEMFGIIPSYEVPESEQARAIHFGATITRHEKMAILTHPNGDGTIGQLLDSYFSAVGLEGGTVADFGLELTPQQFDAVYSKDAQSRRDSHRDYA